MRIAWRANAGKKILALLIERSKHGRIVVTQKVSQAAGGASKGHPARIGVRAAIAEIIRSYSVICAVLIPATMALVGSAAASGELAELSGPELLRVTGKLERTNEGDVAAFDRQMLNALPQHRLETYTDWTEGLQVFEGPLLADLLDHVGASGSEIVASALNDYSAVIPMSDLDEYPVLLALRRNGEAMPVRDKGPIWIIYPNDSPDESQPGAHNEKSIWQLNRLEIR